MVTTGDAAHITAASPGGARYDASLKPAERRSADNGIWLCTIHARQVDQDEKQFPVETLREWKAKAEAAAFQAITTGKSPLPEFSFELDEDDRQAISVLGLSDANLDQIVRVALVAAREHIVGFKAAGLSAHSINLHLAIDGDAANFDVSACANALQASGRLLIVSPPGTGKTTTSIQLVDEILTSKSRVAVLVPLNEWSLGSSGILDYLSRRPAFRNISDRQLSFLGVHGRLTLVLDGWNELDSKSKTWAIAEVRSLQRELPLVEIVVTTRQQALDAPISVPLVRIQPLSETQQLEFARAIAGASGMKLVDRAWRQPGLRELVSIPLYLNTLLRESPTGDLPTTKEEVLRMFVYQHEKSPQVAQVLRENLHGQHNEFLKALAADATAANVTAFSDSSARKVASSVLKRLVADGQIGNTLDPIRVIDTLVDHHALTRTGQDGAVSFHHQQIQEWYASSEVESVARAALAGDSAALARLRQSILDIPAWEESILFMCERVSRDGKDGPSIVAMCIREAMTIDPVLAAEMIYRSAKAVWDICGAEVVGFVNRWHTPGTIDRAVTFMVSSGREEFAPLVWPLILEHGDQLTIRTIRSARRFRPTVLGADVPSRLAKIDEKERAKILSLIVYESGVDGLELAAAIAKDDSSHEVKIEVLGALSFRQSTRLIQEVLSTAPPEVWQKFAARERDDDFSDPDFVNRLRAARENAIQHEENSVRRLGMLINGPASQDVAKEVETIISSEDFPYKKDGVDWHLEQAHRAYPKAVANALWTRLERGFDLPWAAEQFLAGHPIQDDDVFADRILDPSKEKFAIKAVTIAGSKVVGRLIDEFVDVSLRLRADRSTWRVHEKTYQHLQTLVLRTRVKSFIEAWLDRSKTQDPEVIAVLCDLLARHPGGDDRESRLTLDDASRTRTIAACGQFARQLLSDNTATRYHFSEVAGATARIGGDELVEPIAALLRAEVIGYRAERDEAKEARARGRAGRNTGLTIYTSQYRRAFEAIGEAASTTMIGFLEDHEFGDDAAYVLTTIYRAKLPEPKDESTLGSTIDFSAVMRRRGERAKNTSATCSEAEAILSAAARLSASDRSKSDHELAIKLARHGLVLPHGDKTALVSALLALPLPLHVKRPMLVGLALGGERPPADVLLSGLRELKELAVKEPWRDKMWAVEEWLILLPLSDRPTALIEGFKSAGLSEMRDVSSMYRIARAVQAVDDSDLRSALLKWNPLLPVDFSWLHALLGSGNADDALEFLDAMGQASFTKGRAGRDLFSAGRVLAQMMDNNPGLRESLLVRYADNTKSASHAMIEHVFSENPDVKSFLAMVDRFAATGRKFERLGYSVMEHLVLERQALPNNPNSYELNPTGTAELRRELFARFQGSGPVKEIARDALIMIDHFRDEYGRPELEPRHPDIATGVPWPFVEA